MDITPKAQRSPPLCSAESSPVEYKECKHRHNLSSPLKERLKRSRRSFISPSSVAKRLCVEAGEDGHGSRDPGERTSNPAAIAPHAEVGTEATGSGGDSVCGAIPKPTRPSSSEDFLHRRDQLRKEVKEKTETLRRLRLVKMYRMKNDLAELRTLVDKWRSCAQAALYELQSHVPVRGGKASLSEVIDLFGLDDAILHFDRTEEDFTS